jgi:hypothetical protein
MRPDVVINVNVDNELFLLMVSLTSNHPEKNMSLGSEFICPEKSAKNDKLRVVNFHS